MARSANQKSKLLYVRDFLLRNSDQAHPVTVNQIIDCLAEKDIPAALLPIFVDHPRINENERRSQYV